MLTHSELNLLSQLAALDFPVSEDFLPGYPLLDMIDALFLKVHTLKGDCAMSAKEWKTSLLLMKDNKKLTRLKVLAYTNQPQNGLVGYCFSGDAPNSGIIAFRGTTGVGWIDNAKCGFVKDTPQQQKALEFFHTVDQTFNFDHYILTGHSKGGNNGQYITVVDGEKIDQCVTFNSQGFSADFIQKYAPEISANRHKIVSYECAWDIVNILLNSIAGKRVVVGTDSKLPHNNHPPNRLLDNSGDIRQLGRRHPVYAAVQGLTISLTYMASKTKERLYKKKLKH
ncbi:MAG: Mbeg1-like protein [Eubacteriaceae bacterium]